MENYKDKQKKFKEMRKSSISWFWISKLPERQVNGKIEKNPLNKGKTYRKGDEKNV